MKFKILVKLIEKLLGVADDAEGPRADVFLPDKLLALSVSAAVFMLHSILQYGLLSAVLWASSSEFLLCFPGKISAFTSFPKNSLNTQHCSEKHIHILFPIFRASEKIMIL